MIIVLNREMLIPNNERYIGTTYDNNTTNRVFRVARFDTNGVDLSALSFKLDLEYNTGDKDTSDLVKEVDDENINLIWEVPESCLQVPGTVFIGLRGNDTQGTVKYATFRAAVYVEDTIDTPGTYTGDLTELEQLEARVEQVLSSEADRVEAEAGRVEAENARVEAETAREEACEDAIETLTGEVNDAIAEFEDDKDILEGWKDAAEQSALDAAGSAEAALIAQGICETYADIIIPVFHVDFTDGELKYNDTASFTFVIEDDPTDPNYGSLMYEHIVA